MPCVSLLSLRLVNDDPLRFMFHRVGNSNGPDVSYFTDVVDIFAFLFLDHVSLLLVFQIPKKNTVFSCGDPFIIKFEVKDLVSDIGSLNEFLGSELV